MTRTSLISTKTLTLASIVGLALVAGAGAARADTRWSFGFSIGAPHPPRAVPAPVVCLPPVVTAPAPVYLPPPVCLPPVYQPTYAPAPVVVTPHRDPWQHERHEQMEQARLERERLERARLERERLEHLRREKAQHRGWGWGWRR